MLDIQPDRSQIELVGPQRGLAPMGPMLLQPMPSSVTLLQLLQLLARRAWIIALVMLAMMAAAYVLTRPAAPEYIADGAVVVASRKINVPQVETLSMPLGDVAIVRSEMAVIRSRPILTEVAQELALDKLPEFNPYLVPPRTTWLTPILHVLDPRPRMRRLLGEPEPVVVPPTPEQIAAGVEARLAQHLELLNDTRDYVITIRYRSTDAKLSAEIVNAVIDAYFGQYVQSRVSASAEVNALLDARSADLRRDLKDANDRLSEFVRTSGILETRNGTVGAQQLDELNTQLSLARAERATAEARYNALRNGATSKATEVLASPLIQGLREQEAQILAKETDAAARMGPDHPERASLDRQLSQIRGMIGAEVAKIQQSLKDQADIARSREAALSAQVAQLEGTARVSAAAKAEYDRLKTDVEERRHVLDEFLVRAAATTKPGDQQLADVRIIARAVAPIAPAGTRTMFLTALAGIVGLLLSTGGVLAWQRLDHGFESLTDVGLATGVPGLAAIPRMRRMVQRVMPSRRASWAMGGSVGESLRGLRARLQQAALDHPGGRPPRTVLITSALPREGKTSLAVAFAQVAAQGGRRVLLLDCDLRRSGFGQHLSPTAGSTDEALSGERDWRDCVSIGERTGLHYIAADHRARPRIHLLDGGALGKMLAEASTAYELIIIDSPPVMRVPDALAVAALTDAVVVVAGWRATKRRVVAEALRRLRVRPDAMLGVVLTKVGRREAERESYIGYG